MTHTPVAGDDRRMAAEGAPQLNRYSDRPGWMREAWKAQVRKELRLGWCFFTISLSVMLLVGVLGVIVAWTHPTGAMSVISFGILMLHILYLTGYLFYSLSIEKNNSPLWLQNPLPGWSLLAAKFLSGFWYTLLSAVPWSLMTIMMMYLEWPSLDFETTESGAVARMIRDAVLHEGWIVILLFGLASFMTAVAAISSYFVTAALRSSIGRWSVLVGILFFVLMNIAHSFFVDTALYQQLFHWGAIHTPNLVMAGHEIFPDSAGTNSNVTLTIENRIAWLGDQVFDLACALLLFRGTAWLLDRKVEV